MKRPIRVAVTGAAGQIGYNLLSRISAGEMFGPDQPVILQLLEIADDRAQAALRGVAMELEDGAHPLLADLQFHAEAAAFRSADWCLLVGARPRGPNMTRADLLRENGDVFVKQGKALDAVAADGVRVVVVGNPANTNCMIAAAQCRRLRPEQFTAMVRLDQNRAVAQVARKASASVAEVCGVVIFGNHSDTMYPSVEGATVGGRPVVGAVPEDWLRGEFVSTVAQRGSAIIQARGLSSAASAAQALIDHVRTLTLPSEVVHSVAVPSNGEYGFTPGVWAGLPVRTTGLGQWQVVPHLPLSEFGKARLAASNAELVRERHLALGHGFLAEPGAAPNDTSLSRDGLA